MARIKNVKQHTRLWYVVYDRSSDHNGKTLLAHALSNYNWISLYRLDDCDSMVDYFYSIIRDMLDYFLPVHATIRFSSDKPWINDRFKHLIRHLIIVQPVQRASDKGF